jgi:hypothetical protein
MVREQLEHREPAVVADDSLAVDHAGARRQRRDRRSDQREALALSALVWSIFGIIRSSSAQLLPVALRVPLHHARAATDHEAGGGLLGDRNREGGAGQFEPSSGLLSFLIPASGVDRAVDHLAR